MPLPAVAPVAEFILSERAVEDVDVIHSYVCADNPDAADRVEEAIFAAFALLARNPGLVGCGSSAATKTSALGSSSNSPTTLFSTANYLTPAVSKSFASSTGRANWRLCSASELGG